jgi:uncharacterized protein YjeT (DUF2065 family)
LALVLELLTFLGLALLAEGVILALFPGGMGRMMAQFSALAPSQLRNIGLGFALAAALILVVIARFFEDGDGAGMVLGFPATRHFIAGLF